MSAIPENVDVLIFYDKKSTRAINIVKELRKCTKENGERLNVVSDMPLGHPKVSTRISLTRAAHVICLIVTPDFGQDKWNDFEAEISVYEKVESGKPKLIYVQLCETNEVSDVLQHLTCIDGFTISNKDIVTKIKEVYDDQLIMDTAEHSSAVHIPLPENRIKVVMMIIKAVDALAAHFEVDTKIKDLHRTIKQAIACPHQNNTSNKEKWMGEMKKGDYWTDGSTPNLRNIKPADVDQLLNEQTGYLMLASGFLVKKLGEPSDETNIMEYFDNDGILQLLKRCSVFQIETEDMAKIDKIHQIRHDLAHHACVSDEEQEKRWKNDVAEELKENLYGILGRRPYDDFTSYLDQVRGMDIQATSEQGKVLKKELDILKGEIRKNSTQ